MNIRIVDGRLTKDAQVKTSKEGRKYLMFTLANNTYTKGESVTTYFNVVSYNDYDIKCHETDNKFTKGKLFVVSGFPNEVMTIKDNKTYLNRNIIAHNIEAGTSSSRETVQQETTSYRDVAPVSNPTIETSSELQAQVADSVTPVYTVSEETPTPVPSPVPNIDEPDDLPF